MEIKEIEFANYGSCVQINNGILDAVITIDHGPRIVRLGFLTEENLLYCDVEQKHHICNESMQEYYGKDEPFYLYGGHRAQLAPERMPQSFYPDNEPVTYSITSEGIRFTPARQKKNDLQFSLELIMTEGTADLMVVHSVKNCSKETKPLALRAATLLKEGGTAILPQNRPTENPYAPNRVFALWPNTDIRDSRLFLGNRYITLQHGGAAPFKCGINNILGWVCYVNKDYTLLKRFVHASAPYPDFGCSCEVNLQEDYTSLDTLSPSYRVEPGEAIRHVENLTVFKTQSELNPTDEEALAHYMQQLI